MPLTQKSSTLMKSATTIWPWVKTYSTIFGWMNIHLPAILMFTRGTGFWPIAIWVGQHNYVQNHYVMLQHRFLFQNEYKEIYIFQAEENRQTEHATTSRVVSSWIYEPKGWPFTSSSKWLGTKSITYQWSNNAGVNQLFCFLGIANFWLLLFVDLMASWLETPVPKCCWSL